MKARYLEAALIGLFVLGSYALAGCAVIRAIAEGWP
jgi:hypothetical protein